ncbi:hypothetical protein F7725_009416, partial [Dissostichus mawsoni]
AEDTEHVATQAEDTEHVGTQAEDTEHVGTQAEDTEHAGDQAQNPENAVTEKHRETNEEYVILILEPVSVDERRDEIQQRGRKRKRILITGKKMHGKDCGTQGKAIQNLAISIIDHKFMESGHSQMECDSVHAAIETARKKVPVYSPEGYYTLVRMARRNRPYKVIELGHSDFLDFKSFSQHTVRNRTKDTEGQTVRWQKIKWLRYTKEDPKGIQFKYSLSDQPFQMLQVGKQETRGAHAIGPKKMHTVHLGSLL